MHNKSDKLSVGQHAAIEGILAAVGAGLGGVEGAVVGAAATPFAIEVAERAQEELRGRLTMSVARVIEGASHHMRTTPEDLLREALASEESAQLLTDVLAGAARTLNERKIRGFSLALANGLIDDEAKLDDNQIIVSALTQLEHPHIKLLGLLVADSPSDKPMTAFTLATLEQLSGTSISTTAIVATLERTGMLSPDERSRNAAEAKSISDAMARQRKRDTDAQRQRALGGSGRATAAAATPISTPPTWRLSEFGRACWELLDTEPLPWATGPKFSPG